MSGTCAIHECGCKPVARGLCNRHYYQAKRDGTIDQIAPNPAGPCAHCGEQIPPGRRWGAKFCSTECKQSAQDAESAEASAAYRRSRVRLCGWCREPLGEKRMNAKFCSTKCGDDWSNHQRALSARRSKLTARKPCELCGAPIPHGRRADATYCSQRCKQLSQRSTSPAAQRATHAANLSKYGLTPELFDELLARQDGGCAICGITDWPGRGNRPHVDHCHTGGRVRGILCHHCNLGLGNFRDRPDLLRAAADYLERALVSP